MDFISNDVMIRIIKMFQSNMPFSVISQNENVSISYIKKLKHYYKKYLEYKSLCTHKKSKLISLCNTYPELSQALSNNDVLYNTTPSLFRKYYKTINDFIILNKIYDFNYWTEMLSAFHYAIFTERKPISRQVIMNNLKSAGYFFPLNSLAGDSYKFPIEVIDKAYPRFKIRLYVENQLVVAYSNNNKMYFMFTSDDNMQDVTDMFIQKLADFFKASYSYDSIIIFVTTLSGHYKYRSKAAGYTVQKIKEQGLIPPVSDSIVPVE